MIKKLLVLGFAVVIVFASCKKEAVDAKATGIPPATIAGNWKYLKDSIVFFQNAKVSYTQIDSSDAGKDVIFNSNNTGQDFNSTFTYQVTPDNMLQINYPTYQETGVVISAKSVGGRILELSAHKLIYVYLDAVNVCDRFITLTR